MEISKDKKGTHTIQSLLDVMTMREEEELVASDLKNNVYVMGSVILFVNVLGSKCYSCNTKSSANLQS